MSRTQSVQLVVDYADILPDEALDWTKVQALIEACPLWTRSAADRLYRSLRKAKRGEPSLAIHVNAEHLRRRERKMVYGFHKLGIVVLIDWADATPINSVAGDVADVREVFK